MTEQITQDIKVKAIELGFSKIGIARAEKLLNEKKYFEEWINKKYYGTMYWLERDFEKRVEPFYVLTDVKSIVSVALNYFTNRDFSNNDEYVKISRYAWVDDYHVVMTERLEKLYRYIKSKVSNVRGKIFVDAGPVMEKVWAVRSGIGWMGKNTTVITKEYGSWIFLGEILLNIELDYDEPISNFCGTCNACINACPTNAIVEPYVLNANKCISYLTVEHRNQLPDDLVTKFSNWIYGCDVCQEVCPWNRKFSKETSEKAFKLREEIVKLKFSDLISMTEIEFNKKFRRNPIERIKHERLIRNAKAVLDNAQKTFYKA